MGIRKGDSVVVIAGKDKGKKGKVISVDGTTITVDGVNTVIKHKKARNTKQKSAREKKAGGIDISNVMILCKCGKVTRIGHKIDEKGNKARVCTHCGEILDKKFVKTKEKAKTTEAEDKKEDEKVDKKPLVRREVKHQAESRIKGSQVSGGAGAQTTHRLMGGGA
jgi:large subunit ribosomal protein L24